MNADAPTPFDPLQALAILEKHAVRYVLIGGFAARLHGSALITRDLDICYARDRANLENLASALTEMHARLRGVREQVSFRLDAETLRRGDSFTFETDLADFDILGTPNGTGGYDDLVVTAVEQDLGGFKVMVASIDSLLRMKRAAGRPKDLLAVEHLEAVRDEIEHGNHG